VESPPPRRPYDGKDVLVGVIDFGCDYTLADFRDDAGTRIEFLWDQSLQPQDGEQAPVGFGYGVEYNRAAIDRALRQGDPFQVVRHRPEPGSHGTHVLGIAAGNGRSADGQFPAGLYVGMAPRATILFVQPALAGPERTLTDSTRVVDAMSYIFQKARALNKPCVINLSLGQNGGSHDGESIVERAMAQLLEEPTEFGRAIVVAAGNEHVWRGHASGVLRAGEERRLRWQVGGGLPRSGAPPLGRKPDRTPNVLEIWYSSQDRFRVKVLDPNGKGVNWLSPGGRPIDKALPSGNQVYVDSERFTILNGDARIFIEVSPGTSQAVESGTWQVVLQCLEAREGRFDAWIERDLRDPDHQFADQSFFAGEDFEPVNTLATPATARRALAVANYDHHADPPTPEESSGRGLTRDGRRKPEVAAPGTHILSAHALGGRPGQPHFRPPKLLAGG
jgi:subtilisin family serine protease